MEIAISMGTNLGDRLAHLKAAKKRILSNPGVTLAAQSHVYETEPVDVPDEFRHVHFLNCVLIISSLLPIPQLLPVFQFIEQQIGREPSTVQNAPRPMDLDILYAGTLTMNEPHLTIPHPRWHLRRFVVQPLADIRPDLVVTGQTRTVSEILSALEDPHQVKIFARSW